MLQRYYQTAGLECGCDEAGRGCLSGAVFAAAVILPPDFEHQWLNDSKQTTYQQRLVLRKYIEQNAIAYSVAQVSPQEIDQINILQAAIKAMHLAIDALSIRPTFIVVDGNRFRPYPNISHQCIVKGDGKIMSIAAASILAKTYRDDYMQQLHTEYPQYLWEQNKGYPTIAHRQAIAKYGTTPYHRQSFTLLPRTTALFDL